VHKRDKKWIKIKGHDQRDNSEFKWEIHLENASKSKTVYLLLASILPKHFEKLQNGDLAIYEKKSGGLNNKLRVIYLGEDAEGVDTIYSYKPENKQSPTFDINRVLSGNYEKHISFKRKVNQTEEEQATITLEEKKQHLEFIKYLKPMVSPYYLRRFGDDGKPILPLGWREETDENGKPIYKKYKLKEDGSDSPDPTKPVYAKDGKHIVRGKRPAVPAPTRFAEMVQHARDERERRTLRSGWAPAADKYGKPEYQEPDGQRKRLYRKYTLKSDGSGKPDRSKPIIKEDGTPEETVTKPVV